MDGIRFNDERAIDAIRRSMFPTFRDGLDVAIARYRDDTLIAGVVYSEYYRNHSVTMSVHSWERNWLNRDLLFVAFDYPFNQLNVKHVFASARSDLVAFEEHVGFKPVAVIKDFYPDSDRVIMRMDRQDCRFLDMNLRRNLH